MKLMLKIIAAIVALLVVAIIALVIFFDPNMFKPRIEALAQKQGIALNMNGDLGWKLWPSFGIEVNDVRVAALQTPDQPIATLDQASLLLAVKPLLSGNVIVHHVLVDGAKINLAVDAQGQGNWEALTADKPTEDTATPTTQDQPATTTPASNNETAANEKPMELAVEQISLHNSALNYSDAQSGQTIAVEDIQLDIDKFNLQGLPFDMQLALMTRISNSENAADALAIETSLNNQLQLAEDFSSAQLSDGKLKITIKGKDSAALEGTYAVAAKDLQNDLTFSGKVDIGSFNARKLLTALGTELETAESYALSDVALSTQFSGSSNSIVFDPLKLTLDKTHINGSLAVTDFASSAIKVVLTGDEIDADAYLAPSTDEESKTESTSTGDEELIPLETIKPLNADISLDFGKITIADMPLQNIILRSNAKDGLITLNKAQATAYQGLISATGSLDGRGDTALIQFDSKVDKFQLEPFFKDMELTDKINLTGAINANAKGTTRGVTVNQLIKATNAQAQFAGAQVRLSPLNIEEKFCQFVNLIHKRETSTKQWNDFTQLSDLSGQVTMTNGVITVESFKAGVDQLLLGTTGTVNLIDDNFDFTLPLKLVSASAANEKTADASSETIGATSSDGCSITSNYWVNRSISLLRCKGSLATLDPVKDCRPDSKALTSLTKDYAEFKLREKHGDKIDAAEKKLDDKKDELKKKLDEKLGGDGTGEKVEDRLKNLFKKSKDEQ